MSGRARDKVVTSGRLRGKVQMSREPSAPGPPPWPQPAYSLYSTDSEDQVSSLHRGLDQCAALLSGILQADEAASTGLQRTTKKAPTKPGSSTFQGKKTVRRFPTKTASPGLSRTTKGGAAKPRGSSSQGKTTVRKTAAKAGDLQSSERHQPGALEAAAEHKFNPPAAHASVPPPHNHFLSAPGEDEIVPVRDGDGVDHCSLKESCGAEERCCRVGSKAQMVRYLLVELRALIAGQGSVAEKLLSRLEQTVGGSDVQGAALSQNPQVCGCGKNQKEKVEEPPKQEMLLSLEEPRLQKELATAQSSLQELQDDLAELRKALQDTRRQLRDTEAEKALMKTEWEAARNRLQESEREKSELTSVAQQRLKEIENLKRLIQRHSSSGYLDIQNSLSLTTQCFGRQDPAVASNDRIKEYLISLNQVEATQTENVRVSAEREENPTEPKGNGSSHHSITPGQRDKPAETLTLHQDRHHRPNQSSSADALPRGRQLFNSESHCDVESVWSNWSMKSESTFNTRDEAAFREGLAALDASIASLQRTIQLDLKK